MKSIGLEWKKLQRWTLKKKRKETLVISLSSSWLQLILSPHMSWRNVEPRATQVPRKKLTRSIGHLKNPYSKSLAQIRIPQRRSFKRTHQRCSSSTSMWVTPWSRSSQRSMQELMSSFRSRISSQWRICSRHHHLTFSSASSFFPLNSNSTTCSRRWSNSKCSKSWLSSKGWRSRRWLTVYRLFHRAGWHKLLKMIHHQNLKKNRRMDNSPALMSAKDV